MSAADASFDFRFYYSGLKIVVPVNAPVNSTIYEAVQGALEKLQPKPEMSNVEIWKFNDIIYRGERTYPEMIVFLERSAKNRVDSAVKMDTEQKISTHFQRGLGECDLQFVAVYSNQHHAMPYTEVNDTHTLTDFDEALYTAWKFDYIGEHHLLLHRNIKEMARTEPLSNMVSITQSSGMGKSRTVDNLARVVFTMPFNIRSTQDDAGLAFPPSDRQIAAFLTRPSAGPASANIELYYLNFLVHVFMRVAIELDSEFPDVRMHSHQDLAAAWYAHLDRPGVRKAIYDSIVHAATTDWRKLQTNARTEALSSDVKQAFELVCHAIDRRVEPSNSPEDPKFLIYFDESHTLTTEAMSGKTHYHHLAWALNHLLTLPMFTIFISTISRVHDIAVDPRTRRSPTSIRNDTPNLQHPITELPFDCSPEFPLELGELTLADTSTVLFMAQFGRPLFWAMLLDTHSRDIMTLRMINFCRSKLLCQNDIDVHPAGLHLPNGGIAVVDVRLMLDYGPSCEATRLLEAELVSTHMRVAYSVSKSGDVFHTGYSSEPLLAEAAARQWRSFREKDRDSIYQILKSVSENYISKQGRAELVARALLTSAYDRAIERSQGKPLPEHSWMRQESQANSINYSAGVSLITFVEELFTPKYAKDILAGVPVNVPNKQTFRTAFNDAMVRFTHFGRMDDSVSTHCVAAALIRGMAFICQEDEKTVDLIIPVLLGEKSKICEEVVTGVLVRVTNRKHGWMNAYEIEQHWIDFFPEDSADDGRPYISLVMELGAQVKPSTTPTIPMKAKPTLSARTANKATPLELDPQNQLPFTDPNDLHPRYSIIAYGCSDTVYNGMPESSEQQAIYQDLLGNSSFQDEATLTPWCRGLASYGWIDEEILHQIPDDTTPEGLLTGAGLLDVLAGKHDVPREPTAGSSF